MIGQRGGHDVVVTASAVRTLLFAALAAVTLAVPAAADQIKVGSLVIHDPWARATPTGAPVAGGFMRIENTGAVPDRLLGGASPVAGRFEVHEMAMVGDVMQMRALPDGLTIPPGGAVVLKPGSYHVMFIELKQPLVEGSVVAGTLRFEKAGSVEVRYPVRSLGAMGYEVKNGRVQPVQ